MNVDLIDISRVLQLGSRVRMHVSYAVEEKDQPLRDIYLKSQEPRGDRMRRCKDAKTVLKAHFGDVIIHN